MKVKTIIMYILVNKDKIITASANNKVNEEVASSNNLRVYEISDDEFSPEMIGEVLENFDMVEMP